ncbi:PTS mannose/fructose/sorbose/N-acetylgalactosamine transporter subunit IIC [Lactobacillus iners]|uniref:PTS mannose/fructose/sorbose/N-acetylgalactosamine transporter subunit IIC n=1 Tax=Lactobacillus iners TaxID=147802 RepID=UPI001F0950DF|nr:PTS sugar transporter subunit IIC [Lactobacillus iners]MCT7735864.1 PTS sugar transporter subunit IIC [Lactobacillus iners]MCT7740434.1 PTS sugar transporter subunit IIC [Lactobacillus crispatus]MCT7850409.1 PTS sugar transporter subunit IIC [Lactobacillus iners]MCT7886662.1 PTS sugar transporter subunit IIC [Lactobacillus iners]
MAWWQIILITLYSGVQILDELQIWSGLNTPIGAGFIVGLIMGNIPVGLFIGASMQLMILGVGTFGGASRIDATIGTVLATAFSISIHGMSPQVAISSIAVPVATIMIQLDILARFTNTYFAHRIDHDIETFNYKGIERNYLLGALPWALSRAIPVFLALAFGRGLVQAIANALNGSWAWLGNGLSLAGATLPAVGFAILLRYLPVKKHVAYLILGFTITTLFSVIFSNVQSLGTGIATISKGFSVKFNGMPMLAIALLGFALSIMHYKGSVNEDKENVTKNAVKLADSSDETKGEITDDEL